MVGQTFTLADPTHNPKQPVYYNMVIRPSIFADDANKLVGQDIALNAVAFNVINLSNGSVRTFRPDEKVFKVDLPPVIARDHFKS